MSAPRKLFFKPPQTLLLLACLFSPVLWAQNTGVTELDYTLISHLPHDPNLFTQGLHLHEGLLFESSGLYNKSYLQVYEAISGNVLRTKKLNPKIFAEGLVLFDENLYLLTWRAGILFILDPETLRVRKTRSYKGQGWGITHNNKYLITSDGSDTLSFRKPGNFEIKEQLQVRYKNQPLRKLNELEFARGFIWANRWQDNRVYQINPNNGDVVGSVDFSALLPESIKNTREHVLNGIAYDERADAFWITGKRWPVRYFLKITQPKAAAATVPTPVPEPVEYQDKKLDIAPSPATEVREVQAPQAEATAVTSEASKPETGKNPAPAAISEQADTPPEAETRDSD